MDGSKNSIRGLKFALIVAKQSGASVIGMNVCSLPIFVKTSASMRNKTRQKSEEIVKEAKVMAQKAQVSFTGMIKVGNNVGSTIVAFAARHRVDMIIIGSRGPDPEIELFLGSVANHVVNRSKIPVTVVK